MIPANRASSFLPFCAASNGMDGLSSKTLMCSGRTKGLSAAKLMQPVEPGDELIIDATMLSNDNGDFSIKAKLLVVKQNQFAQ